MTYYRVRPSTGRERRRKAAQSTVRGAGAGALGSGVLTLALNRGRGLRTATEAAGAGAAVGGALGFMNPTKKKTVEVISHAAPVTDYDDQGKPHFRIEPVTGPGLGQLYPAARSRGQDPESFLYRRGVRRRKKKEPQVRHFDNFAKCDTDFNREAAEQMYDLVMKMDDDEAEMFCTMVVYDVLMKTIDDNHRTLQRHLDNTIAKRMNAIKRSMARLHKRNGLSDEAVQFVDALTEIEKAANTYDWDPHEHPRDDVGRFSTKGGRIKTTFKQPAPGEKSTEKKRRQAGNIPPPTDVNGQRVTLDGVQQARYQKNYQELANFLRTVANTEGGYGTTHVWVQNDRTGETYMLPNKGSRPDPRVWDPSTEHLVGAESNTRDLTAGGAAFNLVQSLGYGQTRATNWQHGLYTAGEGGSVTDFADEWHTFDPKVSNSRLYNRVGAGSKFLAAIAPNNSKAQNAAKMAQFVGDHGPEAERVFGPPTRKAFYRYRGTEKGVPVALAQEANRRATDARPKDDPEAERTARRLAYVKYLQDKVPTRELSDLQLKSGNTAPSEGILIGADGKAKKLAVGYGDDHYLPFNLKNLKALRGGEYIRTRTSGGPTSEDIYTAMLAGAKSFTVVSNAGTFTMEFEDDFKGGRRYNQKAARMVGRYQRLLDSVRSRQVRRQYPSPEFEKEIREDVRTKQPWLEPEEFEAAVQKEIDRRTASPKLSRAENEEFQRQWGELESNLGDVDAGTLNRKRNEFRADFMEQRALNYQLNGDGYFAAMRALREQFPYYFKEPRYDRRSQWSTDFGYVQPTRNRPRAARANYFDVELNTGEKEEGIGGKKTAPFVSAAHVDYQTGQRSTGRVGPTVADAVVTSGVTTPEITERKKETAPTGGAIKGAGMQQAVRELRAKEEMKKKAREVWEEVKDIPWERNPPSWSSMTPEQFDTYIDKGDAIQEFLRTARRAANEIEKDEPQLGTTLKLKLSSIEQMSGVLGAKDFEMGNLLTVPESPHKFSPGKDGPAYFAPDQDPEVYQKRLDTLAERETPFTDVPINDMSEFQFRAELQTAITVRKEIARMLELSSSVENKDEAREAMMGALKNDPKGDLTRLPLVKKAVRDQNVNEIDNYIKRVHQAWWIRHLYNLPREEGESPKAPEQRQVTTGEERTNVATNWASPAEEVMVPLAGQRSLTSSSGLNRQDAIRLSKNAWALSTRVRGDNRALSDELRRWSRHLENLSNPEGFDSNKVAEAQQHLRSIINAKRNDLEPHTRDLKFD